MKNMETQKVKFKNLINKNIKIEDPIAFFGLSTYLKICTEFGILPQKCAYNSQKLAAYLILNNIRFEYVECVLKNTDNNSIIYHPHAISYWNGHYFDFTLSIPKALNMIQNDTYYIIPNEKCIPVRKFEFNEIKKFLDYSKKNDVDIFMSYMDNLWHINDHGDIIGPTDSGVKNWVRCTINNTPDVYTIECSKFKI